MRRNIFALLTLAVVATLGRAEDALAGKRWTLVQIGEHQWTADKPYIEFDRVQNRASGDAGCNRFSGAVEIKDQSLKVSRVMLTRRACVDDASNRMESRFMSELERTARFEIRDGKLILYAGDTPSLTFAVR